MMQLLSRTPHRSGGMLYVSLEPSSFLRYFKIYPSINSNPPPQQGTYQNSKHIQTLQNYACCCLLYRVFCFQESIPPFTVDIIVFMCGKIVELGKNLKVNSLEI